jgi:hypothetical protein
VAAGFDLETLRLGKPAAPRYQRGASRLPHHAPRERFLRGPIPWDWLQVAMGLPGHALHVGLALWHQAFLCGGGAVVSHSATAMEKWGVSRYAAMRGLAELERAGLVSVDRHSGRKARVTILPAPRPLGRE